jgi:hypothetical protein
VASVVPSGGLQPARQNRSSEAAAGSAIERNRPTDTNPQTAGPPPAFGADCPVNIDEPCAFNATCGVSVLTLIFSFVIPAVSYVPVGADAALRTADGRDGSRRRESLLDR